MTLALMRYRSFYRITRAIRIACLLWSDISDKILRSSASSALTGSRLIRFQPQRMLLKYSSIETTKTRQNISAVSYGTATRNPTD